MKRIYFLLAVLLYVGSMSSLKAQTDDSGWTIGLSFGISQQRGFYGTHHDSNLGIIVTPRIGYRFNQRWEAGAILKYQKFGKYQNYYGLGGYGEYTVLKIVDRLSLFVDMQAYYNFLNSEADGYRDECGITEIGFVPGLKYQIPNSPINFKLRYLFIGYNHSEKAYKTQSPGCLGKGDWILDASLRRLELGVAVTF